jgi:hypothetical protein
MHNPPHTGEILRLATIDRSAYSGQMRKMERVPYLRQAIAAKLMVASLTVVVQFPLVMT